MLLYVLAMQGFHSSPFCHSTLHSSLGVCHLQCKQLRDLSAPEDRDGGPTLLARLDSLLRSAIPDGLRQPEAVPVVRDADHRLRCGPVAPQPTRVVERWSSHTATVWHEIGECQVAEGTVASHLPWDVIV